MEWNDPRISRIIELEWIVTEAVLHGHKASEGDEYEELRKEMKALRLEAKIPNHQQQKHRVPESIQD